MNEWQRLVRLAGGQYGAFSRAQAMELGIPERTLRERVEMEGWERLHEGVYVLPGAVPTYEQAAMAALLGIRPGRPYGKRGVFVAARSAARLWGMSEARQRPVQLVTPFGQHASERGQIYVIRSRTLLEVDAASIGAPRPHHARPHRNRPGKVRRAGRAVRGGIDGCTARAPRPGQACRTAW
ncbi:MAG: type IV toxin-antitoxin system AbiEi family antitoxin domain-containing protein [Egibacteraceae bacterium]